MPASRRVSTKEVIDAYQKSGSVWEAGKTLGISGQSVWERLRSINYKLRNRKWTPKEDRELTELVKHMTISQVAERLGRPYYGVAIRASRLGVATRFGNRIKRKIPRGAGYDKASIKKIIKALSLFDGSLRKFCMQRGMHVTSLVEQVKKYDPVFWIEFSKAKGLAPKKCPGCQAEFYPTTKKQMACSANCGATAKRDAAYFGGNRSKTIGLAEGVCQLCGKLRSKGLHSHHLFGKEHDPENSVLVALCPGCHSIVGNLARARFTESPEGWENLIHLCLTRRAGASWRKGQFFGTFVSVGIEYLTEDDAEE